MTDLDKHPLESMITMGPDVTPDASTLRFMEWVNKLRTTLEQQYKAGLPFSPEIPLGPKKNSFPQGRPHPTSICDETGAESADKESYSFTSPYGAIR